jgi:hypothetical protein
MAGVLSGPVAFYLNEYLETKPISLATTSTLVYAYGKGKKTQVSSHEKKFNKKLVGGPNLNKRLRCLPKYKKIMYLTGNGTVTYLTSQTYGTKYLHEVSKVFM